MASEGLMDNMKALYLKFESDCFDVFRDCEEDLLRQRKAIQHKEEELNHDRVRLQNEKKRLNAEREALQREKAEFHRMKMKQPYAAQERPLSSLSSFAHESAPAPALPTQKRYGASPLASRDVRPLLPEKGVAIEVTVTHVLSPAEFFVRKISDDAELERIMEIVRESGTAVSTSSSSLRLPTFRVHDKCIGLYSDDNTWYRAVVEEIRSGGSSGLSVSYYVHYLDYGNAEWVSPPNIKPMPVEVNNIAPLADKCHLANVAPLGSQLWSDSAEQDFDSLTNQTSLFMKVESTTGASWSVELELTEEKARELRLQSTSLACALVQSGHAQYVTAHHHFSTNPAQESMDQQTLHSLPASFPRLTSFSSPGRHLSSSNSWNSQIRPMQNSPIRFSSPTLLQARPPLESLPRDIPAHPPLEDSFHGNITSIVSLDEFSVHLVGDVNFQKMSKDFQMACVDHDQPLLDASVGALCSVQWNSIWQRCKIIKRPSRATADIFLFDLGFNESVYANDLRYLAPSYSTVPSQSVVCCLQDIICEEKTGRVVAVMEELTKGHTCLFSKLEDVESGVPIPVTVLLPDQRNLSDAMAEKMASTKAPTTGFHSYHDTLQYPPVKLPQEESFDVSVIHVDPDGSIHGQLAQDNKVLEKIQLALLEKFSKSVGIGFTEWQPGQICSCLYDADQLWYRGLVLGIEGNQIKVLYVDFGNTAIVDRNCLRHDIVHLDIPPLSFKMKLRNPPKGNQAIENISQLVVNETCRARLLESQSDHVVVDLYLPNGRLLTDAGLASVAEGMSSTSAFNNVARMGLHLDLETSSILESSVDEGKLLKTAKSSDSEATPIPVFVCQVVMPDFVYLQRITSDDQSYLKVERELNSDQFWAESGPVSLYDVKRDGGFRCASRYSNDGRVYRGETVGSPIEERDGSLAVSVFFVDYGTTEKVSLENLRQMSEEYARIPPRAIPFKLSDIRSRGKWSDESIQEVARLTHGKQLTAVFQSRGEKTSHGILQDPDGRSIGDQLVENGHAVSQFTGDH